VSRIPSVNDLVHVVVDDVRVYPSRMLDTDGGRLTVAAPMGAGDLDLPPVGADLELGWVDERSRYVVPVRLIGLTRDLPPRWQVEVVGEPQQKNRRLFVRGGGGEAVTIAAAGVLDPSKEITGQVVDLSEGGVRCRVSTCRYAPGDSARVSITLKDRVIDATGHVLSVRSLGRDLGIDIVVTYELGESAAQALRRYVFARQLAERRRARDKEY
jgi:PilZ domain